MCLPLTKEERMLVNEALERRGEVIAQAARFIQATCVETLQKAFQVYRHATGWGTSPTAAEHRIYR